MSERTPGQQISHWWESEAPASTPEQEHADRIDAAIAEATAPLQADNARLRAVIHELCECKRTPVPHESSLAPLDYQEQMHECQRRCNAAWDAAMKIDEDGR